MAILFISSKGSQYRYFNALAARLGEEADVVGLYPALISMKSFSGLSKGLIDSGIAFHVARKRAKTMFDLPECLWRLYYLKSAIRFAVIYLSVYSLLARGKYVSVGVWNGHRLPEMAVKAAAKRVGVSVVYFENGLLPDSTTLDFLGVNDKNSVPRSADYYLRYCSQSRPEGLVDYKLEPRQPHRSKSSELVLKRPKGSKYIFVPFQVGFDSQILVNSNVIQSMEEFYALLEDALPELANPDVIFVIKEHPSDPKSYKYLYNRNPRIAFSNESTEELICDAEAVLTINSSVGLESLLLGKKVIVVGEACYKIPGMVQIANDFRGLGKVINNLDAWCPNELVRKGFLSYLENDYVIKGAWQRQLNGLSDEHWHGVCRKLVAGGAVDLGFALGKGVLEQSAGVAG